MPSQDWGALFAGADHFYNHLAEPFSEFVQNLVNQYVSTCDLVGLGSAIDDLAAQHEALFNCAAGKTSGNEHDAMM